LPTLTRATLLVHDIHGRVAQRLIENQQLSAGEHVVAPLPGLANGIYLARLSTDHGGQTVRFAVIR